jgi:hypothetical protein
MIENLFSRQKLAVVLAMLVALNAARFWHGKPSSASSRDGRRIFRPRGALGTDGGPGADNPFPMPDPAMRKRMDIALQKMPEDQRKAIEDRMKEDRAFFESLHDLPEEQRRKKVEEHFAQNPQPPGFGPGGPGVGGPGDIENGEPIHLPPPDVRRSMDQEFADLQKTPGGS